MISNEYNECKYYDNYLLDMYTWQLSEIDKRILNTGIWIVENLCSIRQCSKEFGISKSQIHRDIHNKLKNISYELYKCVLKQFKANSKGR